MSNVSLFFHYTATPGYHLVFIRQRKVRNENYKKAISSRKKSGTDDRLTTLGKMNSYPASSHQRFLPQLANDPRNACNNANVKHKTNMARCTKQVPEKYGEH
jgi:hypothetical protein